VTRETQIWRAVRIQMYAADQIVIDGSDVQKILRKGALVLLHFEIVLVFGKIFGHGDQLVADLVPPFQGLVRPGTHGPCRLIMRLAWAVGRRSGQCKKNERH
jgi:hypothetical protein